MMMLMMMMMMMLMLMSCTEDYISAPFRVEKLSLYKVGDNADKFFRSALRSLLVNYSFVIYHRFYRLTVYYNKCFTLRLAVYQPLCVEVNRVHIHKRPCCHKTSVLFSYSELTLLELEFLWVIKILIGCDRDA